MEDSLYVKELASAARAASDVLKGVDSRLKDDFLRAVADGLEEAMEDLLSANAEDLSAAEEKGLSSAMMDRLRLTPERVSAMADGLREVAALADPVGEVMESWERPNGLRIEKVRVPIGVVLIIYESRPNVTADAAGLCLKAGNVVILRGGSEAVHSNTAIGEVFRRELEKFDLPPAAVTVVDRTSRKVVDDLLKQDALIDLVIPRGGESLIRTVVEKSRIPVIKHYKGVCHVYVDAAADLDMASSIVMNAKVQRPGVCNAMETLLVHESVAEEFLRRIKPFMDAAGVELRGCEETCRILPGIAAATEDDWYEEYLDLILAVRVVPDVDAAIEHIRTYGSGHSDAIVTADDAVAERFLSRVDSAAVYHNASTRFTDGGQFGMGAEIGISTDRIHARGPMGLKELTIYKFVVRGTGQIRE